MNVEQPEFGKPMASAHPSLEARQLLALRRSTSADRLTEPGPDLETLRAILTIASRVPDHRKLVPFRFVVMRGEARARAGDVLARRFSETSADPAPERIAAEKSRFMRAPVVVAVVARFDRTHKTPVWEQQLTNGAVCLNLLLAASAFGYAGNWLTEWYAYDEGVRQAFALSENEVFSGFIYLGSAAEAPLERQRPRIEDLIREF